MKRFRHSNWQENKVVIDWDLSNECNQNCSYCPSVIKSGSFVHADWETVQVFAERMLDHYDLIGKRVHINFGGSGEPTVVPWFPSLLRLLNNRAGHVLLTTNFSAPLEWWEENAWLLSSVHGSIHYEHSGLHDAYEKISYVSTVVPYIEINVPMIPDLFDVQMQDIRWYRENTDIRPTPVPVLKNFISGGDWVDYTDQQKSDILDYHNKNTYTVQTSDKLAEELIQSTVEKNITEVFLSEKDSERCFTGWTCYAGIDTLCIDSRGFVRKGWCAQLTESQIHFTNWSWETSPHVCNMMWCRNGLDLMAQKELR